MEENLYRGIHKVTGEWIYGDVLHWKRKKRTAIVPQEGDEWDSVELFEVFPETVGLFSGKTDKDGKKLFHGDRFLMTYGEPFEKEIRWFPERGCFCIANVEDMHLEGKIEIWCHAENDWWNQFGRYIIRNGSVFDHLLKK